MEYLAPSQKSLEITTAHYSMIDDVIRYKHFDDLLFFLYNIERTNLLISPNVQTFSRIYQSKVVFATFTSPIIHLVCTPKFCISIVFNFSWNIQSTKKKLKPVLMHFFLAGGGGGGGGGTKRVIMGDVEIVNRCSFAQISGYFQN